MEYGGLDLSPSSSAVVLLDENGSVADYAHFEAENTKADFRARYDMSQQVIDFFSTYRVVLGLEDFAQGPGQHVSYQIAEVAGVVKSWLYEVKYPFVLIHPRKRQSYVARRKNVTKNDVIEWGIQNGFSPEIAKRGSKTGYKKRQREDLADAFVLARMTRDLVTFMSEGMPPQDGHLFLDPKTGLMYNEHTRYNLKGPNER